MASRRHARGRVGEETGAGRSLSNHRARRPPLRSRGSWRVVDRESPVSILQRIHRSRFQDLPKSVQSSCDGELPATHSKRPPECKTATPAKTPSASSDECMLELVAGGDDAG